MGLLDLINSPDARLGIGLLAAAGPSAVPQSFGQRMNGLLGQLDAQKAAEEERKAREEQRRMQAMMQQAQMQQMAEASQSRQAEAAQRQAEQTRQQAIQAAYRGAFESPAQQALAGGGGPTAANAQAMQGMVPRVNQQKLIGALSQVDPMSAAQMLTPKPDDTKVVGDALVAIGANGARELYRAPAKPEASPPSVREYEYAKAQGYRGTFEQWDTARKRAGASSVSVNTGQRGLDNTLKLRGDFRSEPIYKAHQEVQSAHAQITQALRSASPAGDLAGATKLMKILDPGSVVRESELGMAMAASGLFDRAQFYAQNVISGTKLTPSQRADFQQLADKLAAESAKAYNAKQSEYGQIAKRNGLPLEDVIGTPATAPAVAASPASAPKFLGFE